MLDCSSVSARLLAFTTVPDSSMERSAPGLRRLAYFQLVVTALAWTCLIATGQHVVIAVASTRSLLWYLLSLAGEDLASACVRSSNMIVRVFRIAVSFILRVAFHELTK